MLYLDYDKSGLDAQYNLRAAVKDFQDYFDQWEQRSKDTRNHLQNKLDIAYGSRPLENLDIFFADQENAPVVVFIHGGYWQRLDKSDFSYIAEGFVHAGVTVAVVNYSLAPVVGYDQAAAIAKEAYQTGKTVREVARAKGVLDDARLNEVLDARSMTKPSA